MANIWEVGPITLERFCGDVDWVSLSDYEKGELIALAIRGDFDRMKIHQGKTVTVTYLGIGTSEGGALIQVEIA